MPRPAASFGRAAGARSARSAARELRLLEHGRARGAVGTCRSDVRHLGDGIALQDDLDRIAGRVSGVRSPAGARRLARQLRGELDRLAQLLRRARLGQEPEHFALVDRALDRVEIGVAGEQDAHGPRRERADLRQHLDAGHLRHAVIGHDDVDVLVADDVERFGAVRREEQIELPAEHDPHRVQHALLVVDEQEPRPRSILCACACMRYTASLSGGNSSIVRRGCCVGDAAGRLIGRMTVKAEPLPTTDSTSSSP